MRKLIILALLVLAVGLTAIPFAQRSVQDTDIIQITDSNGQVYKMTWAQVHEFWDVHETVTGIGTAGSSATAMEYGVGGWHRTELTIAAVQDSFAGDDSLSFGFLVYTFPDGAVIVKAAYMNILCATDSSATADTPDIGIGTTGADSTYTLLEYEAAACENILTGQTATDCDTTYTTKTVADQILVIEATGDHTVYLNIADAWTDGGWVNMNITGTIVLEWVLIKE